MQQFQQNDQGHKEKDDYDIMFRSRIQISILTVADS